MSGTLSVLQIEEHLGVGHWNETRVHELKVNIPPPSLPDNLPVLQIDEYLETGQLKDLDPSLDVKKAEVARKEAEEKEKSLAFAFL